LLIYVSTSYPLISTWDRGRKHIQDQKDSKTYYCSTVTEITGEIHSSSAVGRWRMEVRGSILVNNRVQFLLSMKGPKSRLSINRAYTTSTNNKNLHSLESDIGFEKLARL
jgi:hypothetical protein